MKQHSFLSYVKNSNREKNKERVITQFLNFTEKKLLLGNKLKGNVNLALRAHIKDSTNRNFVLEIVLIYYLKNLILIFFN